MSCYSFFLMIFQKGHDFYEGVRAGKHAHQKRFSNIIIQKFTIVVLLWRSLQVHTATAERKLPSFPQVLLIGLLCGQNLLFQSTRAMLFPLCNLSSLTLFIHHFTFNTDSTEQLHVSLCPGLVLPQSSLSQLHNALRLKIKNNCLHRKLLEQRPAFLHVQNMSKWKRLTIKKLYT